MTARPPEVLTLPGTGGLALAAEAWGTPEDPLVLMLHGAGQTRQSWGDTGAALAAAGFRAIAMDWRGHGDSAWATDGGYELEDFYGDLAAVLTALGRPVHVVGASLGGLAGMTLAAGGQHDIPSLVMVDVTPTLQRDGVMRILTFMAARPDGFSSLEEAAEAMSTYLPHRKRTPSPAGLRRVLRLREGRWHWHWDPAFLTPRMVNPDPERGERIVAQLTGAARALTTPTQLVVGRMTDMVGAEDIARFRELAPHVEVVDVKDAHHMVAGDSNAAFTRAVAGFLRCQPGVRG